MTLAMVLGFTVLGGCAHHPSTSDPSQPAPDVAAPNAAAPSPSSPNGAPPPATVFTKIWPAEAMTLTFNVIPVSFETEASGDCIPGEANYTVDRTTDIDQVTAGRLSWSVCPETGPAVATTGARAVLREEMRRLDLAMTALTLSDTEACAPGDQGKPHLDFEVTTPTGTGTYLGPTSNCPLPPPPPPAASANDSNAGSSSGSSGMPMYACGGPAFSSDGTAQVPLGVQNVDAVRDLLRTLAN